MMLMIVVVVDQGQSAAPQMLPSNHLRAEPRQTNSEPLVQNHDDPDQNLLGLL